VEPIKTIFFERLIRMKALELVPSISGIASKSLIENKVNSGSCESSSAAEGLTNI